ncbi:MAG: ABC transporter permease [Phycisphaerales bacterium]|nr:MAG: ABC transporter permease [Phycisphaerales bacterium]
MQLWALIVDGFRQAVDSKIFWVLACGTVVIMLALLSIGFEEGKAVFLFGAFETESGGYNPMFELGRSRLVGVIIYYVMSLFLGWIGVVLMIIATADLIPGMLQSGSVEVLAAKPISRWRLFLYRYLSGLVFVFLQAALFIGLTVLVMGFRWGVWRPGLLASIPLLVLMFSYLYCVSAAVAVKTRSALACVLITIGAWVVFAMVSQAPMLMEAFRMEKSSRLYRVVYAVSWVPPKTGDLPILAARFAHAGTSSDVLPESVLQSGGPQQREDFELAREIEERQLKQPPVYSIGSSLLFEAVVLGFAMLSFARTDF